MTKRIARRVVLDGQDLCIRPLSWKAAPPTPRDRLLAEIADRASGLVFVIEKLRLNGCRDPLLDLLVERLGEIHQLATK